MLKNTLANPKITRRIGTWNVQTMYATDYSDRERNAEISPGYFKDKELQMDIQRQN
jgi:hypothetical protein